MPVAFAFTSVRTGRDDHSPRWANSESVSAQSPRGAAASNARRVVVATSSAEWEVSRIRNRAPAAIPSGFPVSNFVYCCVGKPFANELSRLSAPIDWACQHDIESIRRFFDKAQGQPLYAVGVGGSFTAARFAALLHSRRSGFAVAQTTLEFCTGQTNLREAHVVLFTGGGSNRDILSAFNCAIANEARSVFVVCASVESPIAARVQRYWHTEIAEFELATGRDGFLATNSLLATCVLLARAFGAKGDAIGFSTHAALAAEKSAIKLVAEGRDELVVLAAGWGTSAGVDLESKCSEAALASVMLSDYRHFAHGRHVWLAKRPQSTAVVALISRGEREIFQRTLAFIPRPVPVVQLTASSGDPVATIGLLCQVFSFVAGLGKALGRDPGRPGVPAFGRRLYHLNVQRKFPTAAISRAAVEAIACERKRIVGGEDPGWRQKYRRFLDSLHHTHFSAVVFDFDGTLCGARDRFTGVTEALHTPLMRLLRGGVRLVIATGRGDSCREALRGIIPSKYWRGVLVGYHNGSDVATLADDTVPRSDEASVEPLVKLSAGLKRRKITKYCDLRLHRWQLTIKPKWAEYAKHVAQGVEELIAADGLALRMVYSSHSFDVLACEASKINVLNRAVDKGGKSLCIGDRGAWPGNDFQLLSTPLALSVDEVSSDAATCWNLSPAGVRCEQATLFYLAGLEASQGKMSFSLERSLRWFRKSLR